MVKRGISGSVKINPKVKIEQLDEIRRKETFKCVCCGKEYASQGRNFYESDSVLFAGNCGYLPFCKDCTERYYKQLMTFFSGNEVHAMERLCQVFDWYYNAEIVQSVLGQAKTKGHYTVSAYLMRLRLKGNKTVGKTTFLDTIKEKSSENEKIVEENITVQPIEGEAAEEGVSVETIKFFGYGYTNEEYDYLEEQYGDWCTRYECKTKAQEELFKNLCVAQLSIQRAQRNGTSKEVNDTMKVFQDLLGTANIKPNQTNDNALAEQNSFGTLIKKWENEKPISEPDEAWKDVDGIKKYIDTYFLGHLCNLVHVKNDNEEAYRRELEKYTAKPPVYEEENSDGETTLLDKFSDKGSGDT